MGKITLNEALKKASVKNDLQMFLGLDAQSELGGMTPERLAAVAGESIKKITFGKTDANLNINSGVYFVNLHVLECVNYPSGLKDFGLLEVFVVQRDETVYILQRLTGFMGHVYTRSKVTTGEWTSWSMS